MELIMLGTGNAIVTECYQTCFVIKDQDQYFMVDGGGGAQILRQLKEAHIDWKDIKDIFVTHKHLDHLTGIIWMMRLICQSMSRGQYVGDVRIYSHQEVINIIDEFSRELFQPQEIAVIGKGVHLIAVKDQETFTIQNKEVTFFDIHSSKDMQYGFTMHFTSHQKLTCCGDEPYHDCEEAYVKDSDWLLHEAFCLYSQADIFHPYEKHHSTVKDACELAQMMNVKNLVLYHTEDHNIKQRQQLYLAEGKTYYDGHLYVPNDLDVIYIDE